MSDLQSKYQAYQEIQAQINALQEKATLLMMEGRAQAIKDIVSLISIYEIRADEVGFPLLPSPAKRERKPEKRRDRTPKGEPKYRDPVSGATWTGTGRVPKWIEGRNHAEFLIVPPVQQDPPPQDPAPVPATDPAQAAAQAVHAMAANSGATPAVWSAAPQQG